MGPPFALYHIAAMLQSQVFLGLLDKKIKTYFSVFQIIFLAISPKLPKAVALLGLV